jgi:hypothetical protein
MLNTDQSINLDRSFIDMSSVAVFNMVRVARSLVFCAVVRRLLFVFNSIDKKTNNTQKTKYWGTRTPLQPGTNMMLRKGKQLLLHPSCFSYYKPGDKTWMINLLLHKHMFEVVDQKWNFTPMRLFPFISSKIPAILAIEVNSSHLKLYFIACGSYHGLLNRVFENVQLNVMFTMGKLK